MGFAKGSKHDTLAHNLTELGQSLTPFGKEFMMENAAKKARSAYTTDRLRTELTAILELSGKIKSVSDLVECLLAAKKLLG